MQGHSKMTSLRCPSDPDDDRRRGLVSIRLQLAGRTETCVITNINHYTLFKNMTLSQFSTKMSYSGKICILEHLFLLSNKVQTGNGTIKMAEWGKLDPC